MRGVDLSTCQCTTILQPARHLSWEGSPERHRRQRLGQPPTTCALCPRCGHQAHLSALRSAPTDLTAVPRVCCLTSTRWPSAPRKCPPCRTCAGCPRDTVVRRWQPACIMGGRLLLSARRPKLSAPAAVKPGPAGRRPCHRLQVATEALPHGALQGLRPPLQPSLRASARVLLPPWPSPLPPPQGLSPAWGGCHFCWWPLE